MTPKFEVSPAAQSDLDAIWAYIADDNPSAATQLVRSLTERFSLLAKQPQLGEARSEMARDLRAFSVGNYVIYYRPVKGPAVVNIARVLHAARDVSRIL